MVVDSPSRVKSSQLSGKQGLLPIGKGEGAKVRLLSFESHSDPSVH
jgi:hypothetical protein